ncbi:MAG: hypothetical protein ACI9MC_001158, partial [Kiritimatiellia bacterium]
PVPDSALDRDNDGYLPQGAGGLDCDDRNASVHPGAIEVCGNQVDDDCDGLTDDDGEGASDFFLDADRDGYGDLDSSRRACTAPAEHVVSAGDCDDGDSAVHPDRLDDDCDRVDSDCDGDIDEDAELRGYYLDEDQDGYGVLGATVQDCMLTEGYAPLAGDCADDDPERNPGEAERCNGVDDDCDDDIDGPVLGEGAQCAARSCEHVHEREGTASGDYYVGDPVTKVRCVEHHLHGRGWMEVSLPWVKSTDSATFRTFGSGRPRSRWADSTEPVVELDPFTNQDDRCYGEEPRTRGARVDVMLPQPFSEVLGSFRLDPLLYYKKSGVPLSHAGRDDTGIEYGGVGACGRGAVVFGSTLTIVKRGGDWGRDWSGDADTYRDYHLSAPASVTSGSIALRWEVHGGTLSRNYGAELADINILVR